MLKRRFFGDNGSFKFFGTVGQLQNEVGEKLTRKAMNQMTGWFQIASGVIRLLGYGVYLDLQSIEADFKVKMLPPKPKLKDIEVSEFDVRRIREESEKYNRTKKKRERSFRKRLRMEKEDKLTRSFWSWQSDKNCRKKDLQLLRDARRTFKKDGILVVEVELDRYLPRVEVDRGPFGSIH